MTDTATPAFPATILAGGRSARMGESKALLPFGEGRLIDHVAARIRPQVTQVLLNANDPAITLPGTTSFSDDLTGFQGPLAGIHAALVRVRSTTPETSHVFMLPVDCPFFPADIVARLASTLTGRGDVALAASGGRMHPVLGLWPTALADDLGAWLADPPTLKVRAFLDGKSLQITAWPMVETALGPLDPFFNINGPDDLDYARRMLAVLAD
jgi:molybdopterin-guanine dinucleotide biosynthesis protein A